MSTIMQKVFWFILLLFPVHAFASQCDQAESKVALYEIKIDQHQSGQAVTKQLELWLNSSAVAIHYSDTGITEYWEPVKGGRLRLVRYFDDHKRGIEYQPDEITGDHDWSLKQQLVSDALLNSMKQTKRTGEGCDQVVFLQKQHADTLVKLQWLPKQRLIKHYLESSSNATIEWQLLEVSDDQSKVAARFQQLNNFQTVDYTDIGDNESDPFLAKMIHMGFVKHGASGYYDAQGNPMPHSGHH